jgi:hypothetical protein
MCAGIPVTPGVFIKHEERSRREIWFLAGIKLDRSFVVPSITRTLLD